LLTESLDVEGVADKSVSQLAESSINIDAVNPDNDAVGDREVAVASARETNARSRKTKTSTRRGSSEVGAR
jgi:hypothetical protein